MSEPEPEPDWEDEIPYPPPPFPDLDDLPDLGPDPLEEEQEEAEDAESGEREKKLDAPLFDDWGVIPQDVLREEYWLFLDEEDDVSSGDGGVQQQQQAAEEGQVDPCPICMVPFDAERDTIALLVGCAHRYHLECLGMWLDRADTCPLCRTAVPDTGGVDVCDLASALRYSPPTGDEAQKIQVLRLLAEEPTEEEVAAAAVFDEARRARRTRRRRRNQGGRRRTRRPIPY